MPADTFVIRPIRPADDAAMAQVIRDVMTEHGCTSEGFAIHDPEVASMSAVYGAPERGYFVVTKAATVLGGGGFARLEGSADDEHLCELRKMYYRPEVRGHGLGRELLSLLLDEMRSAGFRRCYLETTSWMERAQSLYRAAGFAELAGPMGSTGHHGCDRFFARDL